MTDYTSLQAKVNDLKAKVDSNSISPSYVGALLDDFISIIKSSDQEEDVAAALQNAATALTLARSSSTKADNARATAGLAANKCQLALDNYASVKDATDIVNCCLADMLDCGWFCPPSLDDLNAGYGTRVLNVGGTLKLDYPASAPEHVVWLDGPDEPLKSTDYSVEFEFQSSLALSDLSVMLFDNSMTCYKWDNNDPFIRSEVGAYSANEWHRVSIDMAKYIALTGWNQDKSGERLRINFNNIPASGEAVSISIKNIRVYHNQEVKAPEGTDLNTFAGKAKLTSTLIKAIDEAADEELKKAIEGIKNGKVDKVTGKGLSTNDYTDADKAKLTALPTNTQLTQDLASKLNASVWNDAHEQFSIEGSYWSYSSGKVVSDAVWKRTPRIPLNRDAPIILKNVSQSGNAATCFFDEGGNFISAVKGAHGALATIEPSAYPGNAVFVGISTRIEEDTTYSNGDTVEARESAVADAIQASKLALFIDLWLRCYDCQYDPTKAKPFSCNGVELTYQEARDVYNAPRIAYPYFTGANQLAVSAKTLILSSSYAPGSNANLKYAFYNGAYTVIRISSDVDILWVSNSGRAFGYCRQLEKILGAMRLETTTSNEIFFQCVKLQEVKINHLSLDISFHHSPLLSLASLTYLVTYAANTSTITVTVHPDVYAKLTGDTTNAAAAALSADELAQWQSLVSAAAAKNIAFATTE